jgi:FkbM family methyltransferase
MSGFAYRLAYRFGKRITNGRLYGTPLYRGVRGFLRRRLVSDVIETNGYKLAIDPYDSCFDPRAAFSADEPAWEPEIVALMKRVVKPGDVVVDIGAENGYHACLLSGLVGNSGCVYAFEPEPANRERLYRSLELNNIRNVKVIPKAVSHEPGTATLFPNGPLTSLGYERTGNRDGIEVECVRLDDELPPGIKVSLIKMDIEGSEWRALASMPRILSTCGHVITEFDPVVLRKSGGDPLEFLLAFKKAGFIIHHIETGERIDPDGFESRYAALPAREKSNLLWNLHCERT